MIRFEIPVKTLASRDGMNARVHWRTRAGRNKKQRALSMNCTNSALTGLQQVAALRDAVGATRIEISIPSVIMLTRKYSGVALDTDNLAAILKPARDGIADALGIKDNDPRVQWAYKQVKAKRTDFGIIVEMQ